MVITCIDLFDQNAGKVGKQVRVRCTWISLVLVYLIKMQVRWTNKLESDAHGYHRY